MSLSFVFFVAFLEFSPFNVPCGWLAAAAAKSLQSCPTLCDPIDSSPPGSSVPGILQARTLGWVPISFSNAWKWKVKVKSLSHVRIFATPWTAAYQAPPPMRFSRQEYWSGVPLPSLISLKSVHRLKSVQRLLSLFSQNLRHSGIISFIYLWPLLQYKPLEERAVSLWLSTWSPAVTTFYSTQ